MEYDLNTFKLELEKIDRQLLGLEKLKNKENQKGITEEARKIVQEVEELLREQKQFLEQEIKKLEEK